LLQEQNSDQHPKKLSCNPCESAYHIGSIDHCQKKEHDSRPNADPVNSNRTQSIYVYDIKAITGSGELYF
jgi:hypothetical protein